MVKTHRIAWSLALLASFTFLGCEQANSPRSSETPQQLSQKVSQKVSQEAPSQLTVGEGFTNPIGYYEQRPRFSWQINPAAKATAQSAYQIQVASTESFEQDSLLWDSQRVNSAQNAWLPYQGQKLYLASASIGG